MIVAGLIIGAFAGGALGSVSGLGLWILDSKAALYGAARGANEHWLLGKRELRRGNALFVYILKGAATGAGEGVLVGALVGMLFGAGHLAG